MRSSIKRRKLAVVLGQIVDFGLLGRRGRTIAARLAIEIARAVDLERKIHGGEQRIDNRRRRQVLWVLHQAKSIDGKIAVLIELDIQQFGILNIDGDVGGEDAARRALAAFDKNVWLIERAGCQVIDEMDDQFFLPIGRIALLDLMVEHFEIIDAVEGAAGQIVAPALIAAKINHRPLPARLNWAVWRDCVRRIKY